MSMPRQWVSPQGDDGGMFGSDVRSVDPLRACAREGAPDDAEVERECDRLRLLLSIVPNGAPIGPDHDSGAVAGAGPHLSDAFGPFSHRHSVQARKPLPTPRHWHPTSAFLM
jgi:hypothetical protein